MLSNFSSSDTKLISITVTFLILIICTSTCHYSSALLKICAFCHLFFVLLEPLPPLSLVSSLTSRATSKRTTLIENTQLQIEPKGAEVRGSEHIWLQPGTVDGDGENARGFVWWRWWWCLRTVLDLWLATGPWDAGEGEGEGTNECSRGLTRVLYGTLEAATEARNNINLSCSGTNILINSRLAGWTEGDRKMFWKGVPKLVESKWKKNSNRIKVVDIFFSVQTHNSDRPLSESSLPEKPNWTELPRVPAKLKFFNN